MRRTIVPIVCALAVAIAPASALASTGGRVAPQIKLSATDVSWVQSSIQSNMAVVAAADLAEQRTTYSPALKLASALLSQHSKLLVKAENVAKALGITVPTTTSAAYQAQLVSLQKLTGHAFAAAFTQDEVQDHTAFIAATQTEIATGVNAVARGAAKFWLPIEQHRLALAEGAMKAIPASWAAPAA